jgi:5'-phosphate synthase pdxT subunit
MVGVLALQGDFYRHKSILRNLKVDCIYVKNSNDLAKTKALIIPGGESSTMSMLIDRSYLRQKLIKYSKSFPLFGTCAGMIMMSKTKNIGHNVSPLDIMDFTVSRNSWGSQIDSFEKKINLKNFNINNFNAIFIRAPKITSFNDSIKVDYLDKKEPIILDDDRHMVCSFHPELEKDFRLHQYFLDKFYNG